MSFERENIGKVILNDGSEGIYGFVPKGLAKGPNGKTSVKKTEIL